MITGGCLCGGVRYRYDGEIEELALCHCSQCRKAQGTPFASNLPVRSAAFTLERGAELLKHYESSPGKVRSFCSECGSPIHSRKESLPGWLRIRAGTVDGEFTPRSSYHIHYGSRVGWLEHQETFDRYDEGRSD